MDMDCDRFEEDISAYVDGELAPERAARLQDHLAACECCRELRDRMMQLKTSIGDLPEPEIAPEGLWSPATAVAPARPRLTALGIFARVAAVTAVAATSFVFGIVFMGVLQQSAQMGSSPTQLAAPSEEKGAPSGERDQIGAPAPSEEPTSRGDSSVPGYDTSSGPGSAAEPTVTIKPFTGTKPHGAAKAYVLTVDDTMVLIAIDREGKVLSARPLAR
jgi:hypothetical protein